MSCILPHSLSEGYVLDQPRRYTPRSALLSRQEGRGPRHTAGNCGWWTEGDVRQAMAGVVNDGLSRCVGYWVWHIRWAGQQTWWVLRRAL